MLRANNLVGFGVGLRPATVTYTDSSASNTDLTTYTFSSLSIGEASTSRHVIVAVLASNSAATVSTVSTLTVGGVSASLAKRATATNGIAEIWIAAVPTGATGNVVVTFNAGNNRASVGVWAAYNLLSATATDSDESNADPGVISIDVQAGGILVAGVYSSTGTVSYTWTNITERFDIVVETSRRASGASLDFAAAQTGLSITADASAATSQTMVAAAFR